MRPISAVLCCALLCAPPALAAAPQVPLSAFVREATYTNPRLAPDGKHIAITARLPSGERQVPVVLIYSLPELKVAGSLRMPAFEVPVDYVWVSPSRLAISKGKEVGSRELPVATGEILAVDVDGGKQAYLYGYRMAEISRRGSFYGDDDGFGQFEDVALARNGHFFLTAHAWEGKHSMLYDIDATNAKRAEMANLPYEGLRFLLQNDGKPRFAYGSGDDGHAIVFRHKDGGDAWEKLDTDLGRSYQPLSFSPDDKEFVATWSKDGGPDTLVRENLATGKRTVLFADPQASVDGLLYGSRTALPFAARTTIGIPSAHYFDPAGADATLHKMLSEQFPGAYVEFIDFSDDGNLLLFSVRSDREPGSYFLFNKTTSVADLLFSEKDGIDPNRMSPRRPISFKARDGLELYGYLTMPAHAAGAKLPLVLLPHGGPHGPYDEWFFDTDAQFLASRGYAVLQVNYRGSGGRGINFQHSGYRQWGAKIQDDLVDGVKWAIAQGEVDGTRVCAYGASFGAYSALMLAAREPALFKCAVGYAGIYDLNLLYDADGVHRGTKSFNVIKRYVGDDKAELDRFSPVTLAGQIRAPVLLVHGKADKRAPFVHAEAMRAALERAGHPPEWMAVADEGHGFYNTANVAAFYQKLEAFLAQHIGPAESAAATH